MAKPIRTGSNSDSTIPPQDGVSTTGAAPNDNARPAEKSSPFGAMQKKNEQRKVVAISPSEWIEKIKTDPTLYENFAERLLRVIGEGQKIEPKDMTPEEARLHKGKSIQRYDAFKEFYDVDNIAQQLVTYLKGGAKGILVLRGPVGSGKTDLATKLEKLIEQIPMQILRCKKTGELSPFNDSPLCLLSDESMKEYAQEELGVHPKYLKAIKSRWVTKRLDYQAELRENGKIADASLSDVDNAFEVVTVYPSRERQLGVAKYDAGDKNNPDMAALIGSIDIAKVGTEDPLNPDKVLSAGDPDAYKPGLFSQSHGGVLHLAEFFRNNHGMMDKFLDGVTTDYFTGEMVGMLPMQQLIIVTTNDSVWNDFKSANNSEAARNRIEIIDVPYTLRKSQEMKIYQKLLHNADLDKFPMAPGFLELASEFAAAARLKPGIGNALKDYDPLVRVKVLDGEVPKGSKVATLAYERDKASPDQGLSGFSIRDAERTLKATFEKRAALGYREADTILWFEAVRERLNKIDSQDMSDDEKTRLRELLKKMEDRNKKDLLEIVNQAILDADDSHCQRVFDEYIYFVEQWEKGDGAYDQRTGREINTAGVVQRLQELEKRAGVQHPDEFRQSVLKSINAEYKRIAKYNAGRQPEDQLDVKVRWDSYEPMGDAIRAQFQVNNDSKMHILRAKSVSDLRNDEEKKQYSRFHENMKEQGYTDSMVERTLDYISLA